MLLQNRKNVHNKAMIFVKKEFKSCFPGLDEVLFLCIQIHMLNFHSKKRSPFLYEFTDTDM